MPLVQNVKGGVWDGPAAAALLSSPARRKALIDSLELAVKSYGGSGITFDLENLPASAQRDYLALLTEAGARFAARGWSVAVTVPANDEDWNLAAYGRAADLVIVMAYDEHWQTGTPGAIASKPWFAKAVAQAASKVPSRKLVIGLASYGYDWPPRGPATPVSVQDALARAAAAGVTPTRDPSSGELHFGYSDHGVRHQVWFVDAEASRAQNDKVQSTGLRNLALWRLGTEDPAIWDWLGRRAR